MYFHSYKTSKFTAIAGDRIDIMKNRSFVMFNVEKASTLKMLTVVNVAEC